MHFKGRAELRRVDQVEPIRLVDHPLDVYPRQSRRHVDDRLRRARHRDPLAEPHVLVAQRRSPVHPDPRPLPSSIRSHRNLDPVLFGTDAEKGRSAPVAEDDCRSRPDTSGQKRRIGVVTAGQSRNHPAPMSRQFGSADGVDALRDAVQSPARKPMFDPSPAQSERQELTPGHDPVLISDQRPRAPVARLVPFPHHGVEKAPLTRDSPPEPCSLGSDHAEAAADAEGLPGHVAGVV